MREATNTVNVSPRGIYFQSAEPFEVGQQVSVTVNGAERDGEVVRIDRAPGGLHGVAAEVPQGSRLRVLAPKVCDTRA